MIEFFRALVRLNANYRRDVGIGRSVGGIYPILVLILGARISRKALAPLSYLQVPNNKKIDARNGYNDESNDPNL